VDARDWVREFSQYDAGWLRYFKSENVGELRRANWGDLNYPARIATLASAGLPLIQRANPDAIVATRFTTLTQTRKSSCSGVHGMRSSSGAYQVPYIASS